MDDKRALETSRAKGIAEATLQPSQKNSEHVQRDTHVLDPLRPPDTQRVVVHFDADAFYAQCEELRDASLKHVPLGITQKFLVVTCNYHARNRGISKLMAIAEAKRRCPEIVLVNGEDLGPYRAISKRMLGVLRRYGPVQRLGLDEAWVDISEEVQRRLHSRSEDVGGTLDVYIGHVHDPNAALAQDSKHRPMDLRALPVNAANGLGQPRFASMERESTASHTLQEWKRRLAVGSYITEEARRAVRVEVGLRTSAGVACNKLLAKLVSGIHKPDDQTVLLPPHAEAFVAPLPVRALPGVGHKLDAQLAAMGIHQVKDLREVSRARLVQELGERSGRTLEDARWGLDSSPVIDLGPPKSVTVEDSFRSCAGHAAARRVIQVLAPDLIARLKEDHEEHDRCPGRLTMTWRLRGNGYHRASSSRPFPVAALAWRTSAEGECAAALAESCRTLLAANLKEPFDLTLLNLGATSFTKAALPTSGANVLDLLTKPRGALSGVPMHGTALQTQVNSVSVEETIVERNRRVAERLSHARRDYGSGKSSLPIVSKRQERAMREGSTNSGSLAAQPQHADATFCIPDGKQSRAGHGLTHVDVEQDEFWIDLQTMHSVEQSKSRFKRPKTLDLREESAVLPPKHDALFPTHENLAGETSSRRVVLHFDVDCFYCQVERLDDPSLRHRPLAVEQFNSGGFVAVSYEARAAGIRCGDGAGAGGRASVPHLVNMGARSLEECRKVCTDLVVRRMRPDRYRQVSDEILVELRRALPGCPVQKASCDDFYVDVTSIAALPASSVSEMMPSMDTTSMLKLCDADGSGASLQFAPASAESGRSKRYTWDSIPLDLRGAAWIAEGIRTGIRSKLGLTMSCGIARNKLIARLASPLHKPNGLTLVHDVDALEFLRSTPLRRVPGLRAKAGEEVATGLRVNTVAELARWPRGELVRRFGETRGNFLANIAIGIDATPVVNSGPQKTMMAERSFPPPGSDEPIKHVLHALAETLLQRLDIDVMMHGRRHPCKLVVSWRRGYDSGLRSASKPLSASLQQCLRHGQTESRAPELVPPMVDFAWKVLQEAIGRQAGIAEITRLALTLTFEELAAEPSARSTTLKPFLAFETRFESRQPSSTNDSSSKLLQKQDPNGTPVTNRSMSTSASYRNSEALALQKMFAGAGDTFGVWNAVSHEQEGDRASLELAIRLQQEEALGAAANSQQSRPKRQGPLDAFFVTHNKGSR